MRYCKLFFGDWRFLLMVDDGEFSFAFFNNEVKNNADLILANDGRSSGTASSLS